MNLVLGTHNAKKLIELRMLLPEDQIQLLSLGGVSKRDRRRRDWGYLHDNAAFKATEQAKHLGRWVLAEDSGLTVDALQGQPGVYSARYAGEHGDDEANNEKLLRELADVPAERRGAQFNSYLCLSDPTGQVRRAEHATCSGRIATQRSGSGGIWLRSSVYHSRIPSHIRRPGFDGQASDQSPLSRMRQFVPRLLKLLTRCLARRFRRDSLLLVDNGRSQRYRLRPWA